MKSPLRWPGGKGRLAGEIIGRMPRHAAYVEACCGGASVFWVKRRDASTAEVLNDRDGELINFYYVLHKRGKRLAREVDCMPYSRMLFSQVLADRPRSAFGRARRFWYLNRVAFGGQRSRPTFGVQISRRACTLTARIMGGLDSLIERMRGVLFEAVDVERLIKLYDRPDTLFYVDPPFYGTSQTYACTFAEADHTRLAASLAKIRGAFMLSYDDHPTVKRLYRRMRVVRLTTRYTMGCNSSTGGASKAAELLITNRPWGVQRQSKRHT